ncbi:hypothetical protein PBRA_008461, partial [Plasmodiophora brassicae]
MAAIFDDMKDNLLIWIDDLLGFAKSEDDLLHQLTRVLERCRERNVKLNPGKCTLFARELKWCGRIYSRDGVRHDPERIEALTTMSRPRTVKELQQFLWAANWMRTHIPGYPCIIRPLQDIIDRANDELKRIRSATPSSITLDALGWSDQHNKSFTDIRFALIQHVQLAYPKSNYQTCLFTDASETAWAAVITQIPLEDIDLPVCDQRHEPLAFYGKRFAGSELRWSTPEKEAAAIIYATERGDFLLQTSREFLLYTDHRNLTFIFSQDSEMKKHTAQKLERWALHLQGFRYQTKSIAGEDNVWADLLTRWGAGRIALSCRAARIMELDDLRVTPRQHPEFSWPTETEIRDAQRLLSRDEKIDNGVYFDEADRLWKNEDKAVLIPCHLDCKSLRLRILIIGHCASAGHRAYDVTKQMIMERFVWKKISQDIQAMCQQCLHCITTRGGKKVPRPLGEALHGHKPFDVLTMDYVTTEHDESTTRIDRLRSVRAVDVYFVTDYLYVEPVRGTDHQYKYILLLKDDFSGYVRLIPSAEATSRVATEALNQWIADFATPEYLVTDGGSHFTAEIMEELTRLRDVQHHITTAYCPWANGTVERANRTVLNVMRSILNEAQITTHNWPYLCPVVQHVINHTPSRRLNGYAPITVVTGRSPESPLDQIWDPKERQWRRIPPEGFAKYVPT